MESARNFLSTAISDNRTQMKAISDVADRTETGTDDPKVLIETLMSELAKAATRASKLEAGFAEKSRELDMIRESLSQSEERARTDILTGLPNRRSTGQELPGITVSIGVGQFLFGESMDDLIERCDRAMYQAKRTGRNRVVSEQELEPEPTQAVG